MGKGRVDHGDVSKKLLKAFPSKRQRRKADVEVMDFRGAERAFREGNQLALWDVVLRCERRNILKPEWARQALIQYAGGLLPRLARPGRSSRARFATVQRGIVWDMLTHNRVIEWRAMYECDQRRAIRMAAKELVGAKANADVESAMRRMVARARVRNAERAKKGGVYISPALEEIANPLPR